MELVGVGWSHLGDQFSVGFAAPRIISGRHCRLGGLGGLGGRGAMRTLRSGLVNSLASTSLAVRISYQSHESQDLWA